MRKRKWRPGHKPCEAKDCFQWVKDGERFCLIHQAVTNAGSRYTDESENINDIGGIGNVYKPHAQDTP